MEKEQDSKMSKEPVGRLMLTMGLPIVLSMMLQAGYNIVDSAYYPTCGKPARKL